MKRNVFIIAGALPVMTLASCSGEAGDAPGGYLISLAVVDNRNGDDAFYFVTDGGERMWTAETVPGYIPGDGQRIHVKYDIIPATDGRGDHSVRMLGVREVLTKPVEYIRAQDEGRVGNDPISIDDIWLGGGYLNAEFLFRRYNRKHFINLVVNEERDFEDGKIHLELRHNANDDQQTVLNWGLVSFDLNMLGLPDSEATMVIHYRDAGADGAEETWELRYVPEAVYEGHKSFKHEEHYGMFSFI